MTAGGDPANRNKPAPALDALLLESSPRAGDIIPGVVVSLFLSVFAAVLISGLLHPQSLLAAMFVCVLLALLALFWWSAVGRECFIWRSVWIDRKGLTWRTSILGRWKAREITVPLGDVCGVALEWDGQDSFKRRNHWFVFDTHSYSKRWVHVGWARMVDGAVAPRVLTLWNGLFRFLDSSLDRSGLAGTRTKATAIGEPTEIADSA